MKSVEWRPESDHELASAGRDNTVMVWDLRFYLFDEVHSLVLLMT